MLVAGIEPSPSICYEQIAFTRGLNELIPYCYGNL